MSNHLKIPEEELNILRKIFPQGVIAFDLETTGLAPLVDKIIEIAALKVTKDGIQVFDELINPGIPIPQMSIDIHGITDEDVQYSPSAQTVIPRFLNFCKDLPLIAHNAKFDIGFLVFDIHLQNLFLPKSPVFCSVKYSRTVFKTMPNHKLSTLVEKLDIPLFNHHRALDDAMACLRIFAKGLSQSKHTFNKIKSSQAFLFNFNDFKKNKSMAIPQHLQGLIKKAKYGQIVDIKYLGGSLKGQYRPIRPVSFLPMPEGNILYAHCLHSNLYKSFSLKKIAEFRELSAIEIQERLKLLEK